LEYKKQVSQQLEYLSKLELISLDYNGYFNFGGGGNFTLSPVP
jgi:hypothetical protein